MSQDYFSDKGKSPARPVDDEASPSSPSNDVAGHSGSVQSPGGASLAPAFATVGSGSTSKYAAHLQQMLERDSGYGGSVASGSVGNALLPGSPAWENATHADTPPIPTGSDRRQQQPSAVHQLWYNQQRGVLNRAINKAVDMLTELQDENAKWPAHYPSVQRAEADTTASSPTRPDFRHTSTNLNEFAAPSSSMSSPPPIRRAMTSLENNSSAESSRAAEKRLAAEPRLVTPQIAQEFSVLKLDLKLGALHQTQLVHSLEKGSIASLLDGKISSSITHLLKLRERIEDTASKVLITGDLNAGKSTFCNALLRRKVLPEDQQPCTSIFCEVLDYKENSSVEEVHAVHKNAVYDRNDESTYDVYSLAQLEDIVIDNDAYLMCKVYVKEVRSLDESLLNNGVVDIALIDAPGLNSDTTKTTAVFARQEEIDVVVFVVSAANHFTQSAKEFLWAAASEKAYLFIVVNGFDMIRDQRRCQKMILDQVAGISPRTHKESAELVHFVSSNAIPTKVPSGGPGGDGSGSSSGGGGGDDDPSDPKGKGKDVEKMRDFQNLEQSLRRFVLEKRARSKLAPAKHYLLNILGDVNSLANVNAEVAQAEVDRVGRELREIEPQLEASKKAQSKITEDVNQTIDETCDDVYQHTRASLNEAILHADENIDVPYPGIFQAFDYAEDLKAAMLQGIQAGVSDCEEYARQKAVGGVQAIKQLGILHLGNEYTGLNFHPDVMFRRRRDALAKQIDIPTELLDFVDWSTLLQRQEKVAGTGMALTVATTVGMQVVGGYSWMNHALSAARIVGNDNLRRMILPGLVLAAVAAASYVLSQIPHSLPHRLSQKISTQLAAMEYSHNNATRISGSVRKVLHTPKDHVVFNLNRSVEQLGQRREETLKVKKESHDALRYFTNLARSSGDQRAQVEGVDLEAVPGGAGM
ncbi:transmembrane GTPase fzo1 [Coniella lustricola]|uniref:Transmembrane GTPase fzo1 n=1 Tax=Coniella lustricola TaxID=2025994 RepID=A0A2T3AK86_9PEZI|nr:transmembrane GTPase fzo1 [Coniella lustricola]